MDLSSLNSQQREAVEHIDGPCCVVAGAGSGKTRVLTYRVANLVNMGVPAKNILAVTFTRKAAGEMQERLQPLIGDAALEDLNVGTFHSICYRILRDEWRAFGQTPFEPAQEHWVKRTIRTILEPPSKNNPQGMNWGLDVASAIGFISWQKNNMITPDDRLDLRGADPFLEMRFQNLYKQYELAKDREHKLDFDDMLLWCYQLLRDNPAVLRKYRSAFRYILVDEFQDTNLAQYEILKLLAEPEHNVFVVGDARQAIYGWRAARVEFILEFERTWPGARVIILETNYRSSQNIVELSNAFIHNSSIKYPGECKPHKGASVEPIYLASETEDDEAAQITEEIKALIENKEYEYKDFAILYRTNAQSRAFEDALIAAGIPYVVLGAIGFYNRKEVKDIIAYLRILADPNDDEAIRRVINVPTRYLGKAFLTAAREYSQREGISLLDAIQECPEARQHRYRGARDFIWCIDQLRRLQDKCSVAELTIQVRKITGYDAWLAETEGVTDGADNQRLENLDALAAAAARFGKLEDFLFYVEQAASKPTDPETGGDKVQLMTLHRSKGLEFPVVFLAGMVQGLLPHRKSCVYIDGELVPESIEEERRLCYVGITRAKERLYLSTFEAYQGRPVGRSMFLDEIRPVEMEMACNQ